MNRQQLLDKQVDLMNWIENACEEAEGRGEFTDAQYATARERLAEVRDLEREIATQSRERPDRQNHMQ